MGLEVSFEGVHGTTGSNVGWLSVPNVRSRDRKRPTRKLSSRFWDDQQRASDDRRGRTGTAVWIRSFKYAVVEWPHPDSCFIQYNTIQYNIRLME